MFDVDVEKVVNVLMSMLDKAQSAPTAKQALAYCGAAEVLSRVFVNLKQNSEPAG